MTKSTTFPVLPLRDIVVFPHMMVPLYVGRPKSIAAVEEDDVRRAAPAVQANNSPPKTSHREPIILTRFTTPA